MLSQFTQFGTNLIAVNPGRSQTLGMPGVLGGTTHKLTLDDAEAVARVPGVVDVAPFAMGTARVEAGERGRSVFVYGATPAIARVLTLDVRQGSFWPAGDPRRGAPVALLGPTLARELFERREPPGARDQGGRHALPHRRRHGAEGPASWASTSTTRSTCPWPAR